MALQLIHCIVKECAEENDQLSEMSQVYGINHEVCALYPPVKEKVHCSAPNSVKNLVMHRIR